jgi:hypothetical protein
VGTQIPQENEQHRNGIQQELDRITQ